MRQYARTSLVQVIICTYAIIQPYAGVLLNATLWTILMKFE